MRRNTGPAVHLLAKYNSGRFSEVFNLGVPHFCCFCKGGNRSEKNVRLLGSIERVWAFELPQGLPIADSRQAQSLARKVPVLSWRVEPSKKMKEFIGMATAIGIRLTLNPRLTLHGDMNRLWGDCGLSHFEATITNFPGAVDETTALENDLWKESARQRPRQ